MQEAEHIQVCSVAVIATAVVTIRVVASFRKLENFAFRGAILLSSLPCFVGH